MNIEELLLENKKLHEQITELKKWFSVLKSNAICLEKKYSRIIQRQKTISKKILTRNDDIEK